MSPKLLTLRTLVTLYVYHSADVLVQSDLKWTQIEEIKVEGEGELAVRTFWPVDEQPSNTLVRSRGKLCQPNGVKRTNPLLQRYTYWVALPRRPGRCHGPVPGNRGSERGTGGKAGPDSSPSCSASPHPRQVWIPTRAIRKNSDQ